MMGQIMPIFYAYRRHYSTCSFWYNFALWDSRKDTQMEAEQLNAIENHLADLMKRSQDLRGYL
jgi:hypothetical protein